MAIHKLSRLLIAFSACQSCLATSALPHAADSEQSSAAPAKIASSVGQLKGAIQNLDTDSASIRQAAHSRIQLNSNNVCHLGFGEILVHAKKKYAIWTGRSAIVLQPETIAVIYRSKNMLRVYNLNQGSANVYIDETKTAMVQPGQELVIRSKEQAPVRDGLGRRAIHSIVLNDGATVTRSEICPSSVMRLTAVRQLAHSHVVSDQKLVESILKAQAAVSLVTAGRGLYSASSAI